MVSIEISASAVAWYAAIVATISAGVGVYNAWRDRLHLRFRFAPNMKIVGDYGQQSTAWYLYITIANTGKRPITISHLSFLEKRRGGEASLLKDSIEPRELQEGKSAQYLCEQSSLNLTAIRYVSIADAAGGIHRRRIPRHVRKALAVNVATQNDKNGEGKVEQQPPPH